MNAPHTPGHMKPGVSLVGGIEHFTVVPHGSEQTVVAMCGLTGAEDEPESVANARRLAACWNACLKVPTEVLEAQQSGGLPWNVADQIDQCMRLDELLQALKGLEEAYCRAGSPLTRDERLEDRKRLMYARAAIAKATGSAT